MPKKVNPLDVQVMKVKRLEAELDNALLQVGALQRENSELRIASSPALLRGSLDALVYCSKLPEFALGGKHHQGFDTTVRPILTQLQQLKAGIAPAVQLPEAPPAPPATPE